MRLFGKTATHNTAVIADTIPAISLKIGSRALSCHENCATQEGPHSLLRAPSCPDCAQAWLFEARAEDVEIAGCKLFISGNILYLDHELQLHSSGGKPRQIRRAKDFKLHKAVLENRLVIRGENSRVFSAAYSEYESESKLVIGRPRVRGK